MSVMGEDQSAVPEAVAVSKGDTADAASSWAPPAVVPPELLVRFWPELFGIPAFGETGTVSKIAGRFMRVDVPGRALHVDQGPLAVHLLAVPLFTLLRDGVMNAEVSERKLLGLLPLHSVVLRPTGNGAPTAGIAKGLTPSAKTTVRDVVRAWFREDVPAPEASVIATTHQVGQAHGFYTPGPARQQHVIHRPGSKPAQVLYPMTDRVSRTRAAGQDLADAWDEFGKSDPKLRSSLYAQVAKAIKSRRESDDDDDSDFGWNDN